MTNILFLKKIKEDFSFTLVEVLIALVIITFSIVAAMIIFRNGFLSFEKVRLNNKFAGAAMVAMEIIKCTDLSKNPEGKGVYGSIKYSWEAKKLKSGGMRIFKGNSKASSAYEIILYRVKIFTKFKNISREFVYYHIGWLGSGR